MKNGSSLKMATCEMLCAAIVVTLSVRFAVCVPMPAHRPGDASPQTKDFVNVNRANTEKETVPQTATPTVDNKDPVNPLDVHRQANLLEAFEDLGTEYGNTFQILRDRSSILDFKDNDLFKDFPSLFTEDDFDDWDKDLDDVNKPSKSLEMRRSRKRNQPRLKPVHDLTFRVQPGGKESSSLPTTSSNVGTIFISGSTAFSTTPLPEITSTTSAKTGPPKSARVPTKQPFGITEVSNSGELETKNKIRVTEPLQSGTEETINQTRLTKQPNIDRTGEKDSSRNTEQPELRNRSADNFIRNFEARRFPGTSSTDYFTTTKLSNPVKSMSIGRKRPTTPSVSGTATTEGNPWITWPSTPGKTDTGTSTRISETQSSVRTNTNHNMSPRKQQNFGKAGTTLFSEFTKLPKSARAGKTESTKVTELSNSGKTITGEVNMAIESSSFGERGTQKSHSLISEPPNSSTTQESDSGRLTERPSTKRQIRISERPTSSSPPTEGKNQGSEGSNSDSATNHSPVITERIPARTKPVVYHHVTEPSNSEETSTKGRNRVTEHSGFVRGNTPGGQRVTELVNSSQPWTTNNNRANEPANLDRMQTTDYHPITERPNSTGSSEPDHTEIIETQKSGITIMADSQNITQLPIFSWIKTTKKNRVTLPLHLIQNKTQGNFRDSDVSATEAVHTRLPTIQSETSRATPRMGVLTSPANRVQDARVSKTSETEIRPHLFTTTYPSSRSTENDRNQTLKAAESNNLNTRTPTSNANKIVDRFDSAILNQGMKTFTPINPALTTEALQTISSYIKKRLPTKATPINKTELQRNITIASPDTTDPNSSINYETATSQGKNSDTIHVMTTSLPGKTTAPMAVKADQDRVLITRTDTPKAADGTEGRPTGDHLRGLYLQSGKDLGMRRRFTATDEGEIKTSTSQAKTVNVEGETTTSISQDITGGLQEAETTEQPYATSSLQNDLNVTVAQKTFGNVKANTLGNVIQTIYNKPTGISYTAPFINPDDQLKDTRQPPKPTNHKTKEQEIKTPTNRVPNPLSSAGFSEYTTRESLSKERTTNMPYSTDTHNLIDQMNKMVTELLKTNKITKPNLPGSNGFEFKAANTTTRPYAQKENTTEVRLSQNTTFLPEKTFGIETERTSKLLTTNSPKETNTTTSEIATNTTQRMTNVSVPEDFNAEVNESKPKLNAAQGFTTSLYEMATSKNPPKENEATATLGTLSSSPITGDRIATETRESITYTETDEKEFGQTNTSSMQVNKFKTTASSDHVEKTFDIPMKTSTENSTDEMSNRSSTEMADTVNERTVGCGATNIYKSPKTKTNMPHLTTIRSPKMPVFDEPGKTSITPQSQSTSAAPQSTNSQTLEDQMSQKSRSPSTETPRDSIPTNTNDDNTTAASHLRNLNTTQSSSSIIPTLSDVDILVTSGETSAPAIHLQTLQVKHEAVSQPPTFIGFHQTSDIPKTETETLWRQEQSDKDSAYKTVSELFDSTMYQTTQATRTSNIKEHSTIYPSFANPHQAATPTRGHKQNYTTLEAALKELSHTLNTKVFEDATLKMSTQYRQEATSKETDTPIVSTAENQSTSASTKPSEVFLTTKIQVATFPYNSEPTRTSPAMSTKGVKEREHHQLAAELNKSTRHIFEGAQQPTVSTTNMPNRQTVSLAHETSTNKNQHLKKILPSNKDKDMGFKSTERTPKKTSQPTDISQDDVKRSPWVVERLFEPGIEKTTNTPVEREKNLPEPLPSQRSTDVVNPNQSVSKKVDVDRDIKEVSAKAQRTIDITGSSATNPTQENQPTLQQEEHPATGMIGSSTANPSPENQPTLQSHVQRTKDMTESSATNPTPENHPTLQPEGQRTKDMTESSATNPTPENQPTVQPDDSRKSTYSTARRPAHKRHDRIQCYQLDSRKSTYSTARRPAYKRHDRIQCYQPHTRKSTYSTARRPAYKRFDRIECYQTHTRKPTYITDGSTSYNRHDRIKGY
ncbi:LOW QUALITY PROTEIN: hypothetical protein ElyMa_006570000 [Elysia marginata]|uniref:Uncharacterized protein n=1 Tax=Elysia marginata TaxID=1093978 RepID=A0AAV4IC32_9GAST|nr:LOW QUALITY PROTEIN: hypothetical protein ElyMa_006570000 [Elysia marginata]